VKTTERAGTCYYLLVRLSVYLFVCREQIQSRRRVISLAFYVERRIELKSRPTLLFTGSLHRARASCAAYSNIEKPSSVRSRKWLSLHTIHIFKLPGHSAGYVLTVILKIIFACNLLLYSLKLLIITVTITIIAIII